MVEWVGRSRVVVVVSPRSMLNFEEKMSHAFTLK